jgi:hypothetical protein
MCINVHSRMRVPARADEASNIDERYSKIGSLLAAKV